MIDNSMGNRLSARRSGRIAQTGKRVRNDSRFSRRRYKAGSAGIGFAAAGLLFLGQAGAAHAPIAAPSIVPAPLLTTATALPASSASQRKFSAKPFLKLRITTPPAALRLTPSLGHGSYARLALGPIVVADGALNMPGRLRPEAPKAVKVEPLEVGHGVSVPTAVLMAEAFNGWSAPAEDAAHHDHAPAFAGLPLVSSAHAAEAEGLGGPLSRMPVEGHILFKDDGDALDAATQAQLDRLVDSLRNSHALLEVIAYGGGRGDRSSKARQLSLRRGLAVRAYLVARGIAHQRITVRPMGGARDGGPEARVDVFYASY